MNRRDAAGLAYTSLLRLACCDSSWGAWQWQDIPKTFEARSCLHTCWKTRRQDAQPADTLLRRQRSSSSHHIWMNWGTRCNSIWHLSTRSARTHTHTNPTPSHIRAHEQDTSICVRCIATCYFCARTMHRPIIGALWHHAHTLPSWTSCPSPASARAFSSRAAGAELA